MAVAARSFAEAVDVRCVEVRRVLLREAGRSLRRWEQHRDPEDRGRLLLALETLALLIRACGGPGDWPT